MVIHLSLVMIVFLLFLGSFTCGTTSLVNELDKLNLDSLFSQTLSLYVSGGVGVKRQSIVENPIERAMARTIGGLQKKGCKPSLVKQFLDNKISQTLGCM